MTKIHWFNAVDGDFNTAADWDAGVAPGAEDRAFLGALDGSAYTVTASSDEIVGGLRIAANATLAITGGVFVVRRDIGNSGVIALNSAGGDVRLEINGATATTLRGGGQIILGDDKSGFIGATRRHHGDLVNVDNTISGAGRMEGLGFRFDNQAAGVVNATESHNLVLKHVVCANEGLLEGTGAGGLTLKATTTILGGPNGVILAGADSTVHLRGATISGGTLSSTGSGRIVVTGFDSKKGGARWEGLTSTVHNRAVVDVVSLLQLQGMIDNSGAIMCKHRGQIDIGDRGATLTGGGSIALHSRNAIFGETLHSKLINVDNTISGAGLIGSSFSFDQVTLFNQQNGVIDATARKGLTINRGKTTVKNDGLIETTGVGVCDVVSGVVNNGTLMAAGGALTVEGAVTGTGSGAVDGGTLAFGSSFTEDVRFSGTAGVLALAQSQGYAGKVSGFSLAGGTSLDLRDIGFTDAGEATFSGDATSGVLTVTDGTHTAHITLIGDYRASTFVASSDGNGGTFVQDPSAGPVASSPPRIAPVASHTFVAAMAGMGGGGGSLAHGPAESLAAMRPTLTAPRAHFA